MATKKLAVLVVHGIGSQGPDFADGMTREVRRRLERAKMDPDLVVWKTVHWAPIVEEVEKAYWKRAKRDARLRFENLRSFVVSVLSDAIAYQETNDRGFYTEIQARIAADVATLHAEAGAVPLVVMAHSLGGILMQDYIWDVRKRGSKRGKRGFERFSTMKRFITFGSNIPLFAIMHRDPWPPSLPSSCRWLNYYDPDDILGWPLRSINDRYRRAVHKDIPVSVGGPLTSWNPASHLRYWTDNDFTRPVAEELAGLL